MGTCDPTLVLIDFAASTVLPPGIKQLRDWRMAMLRHAHILIDKASAFDCTARKITAAGAQLRVQSVMRIPDRFELTIDPSDERRSCRVIWRTLDELGVRFEPATA